MTQFVRLLTDPIQFQLVFLGRLSENEAGVASLFQVPKPSRLSPLSPVRGPRQEGQSLQGVHEERGVATAFRGREPRYMYNFQLLLSTRWFIFPYIVLHKQGPEIHLTSVSA